MGSAFGIAGGSAGSPDLLVFLVIGLLGGAHCLGMCGPLVTAYADRMGGRSNAVTWNEIGQHALFNAGRTASYALVGAALGLAGGVAFDAAGVLAAGSFVRAAVGVGTGIAIAVVGLGYVLRGTNALGRIEGLAGGPFVRAYAGIANRTDDWVGGPRITLLGALHGFLPCPILYPAFLYALARGSPVRGGLALLALGVGTFPTLFLYGTAFGSLAAPARRRLHRALGVAFLALGYLPLSMGLRAAGIDLPGVPVPFYQPLG